MRNYSSCQVQLCRGDFFWCCLDTTPWRYQGRGRISPTTHLWGWGRTGQKKAAEEDRAENSCRSVVRGCPAPGCSEIAPSQMLISIHPFKAQQNIWQLHGCTVITETNFTTNGLQWTYFCILQQSTTARECFLLPVDYLLSHTYIKLWIFDLKFLFPSPKRQLTLSFSVAKLAVFCIRNSASRTSLNSFL